MLFGVIIREGPQNWQIIQQENGTADVSLRGTYSLPEGMEGDARVYARLVKEDCGENVVPWTECLHHDGNRWEIVLRDVPAGGLYRIETCLNCSGSGWAIEWGIRGDMIHHLGVGDLFVIAGQSNSAGYGKDPVYDPPELGVHVFRNNGKWDIATHPLNDSTGIIHIANTELVNPGHSPYLSFGKYLKRSLGYPIGLMQASLGGSSLGMWCPDQDGTLYRNMLDIISLCGGKIKGVLWYQGCSDVGEGSRETYLERFSRFVSCLRKDTGMDSLPFLTVQLNRKISAADADIGWAMIREAQRQAAKTVDGVYIVPANDCMLSDDIHNSSASNMVLGERMARSALFHVYHRIGSFDAPDISQARSVGGMKVELEFDNVRERLSIIGWSKEENPFCIQDDRGEVGITECYVENRNRIVCKLARMLQANAFIHGFHTKNLPSCKIIDVADNLPILSFYNVRIIQDRKGEQLDLQTL